MAKKKQHRAATAALQVCTDAGIEYTSNQFPASQDHFGESAAEYLKAEGIAAEQVFKTLIIDLNAGKGPKPLLAVAVLPVTERLSLKHAAAALGHGKACMADPKVAERSTGYIPGGISPLGQRTPLPTVVHDSALELTTMYVSGGKRGLDIGLAPADLISLTNAVTADIAEGH